MGIPLNSHCVDCLLSKHIANARELGDEETAFRFAKAVMQLILDAGPEVNSSMLSGPINKLYMDFYGLPQDRHQAEKLESNRFVMARLEDIRRRVREAGDPVLTALQYAILGNYIDYSALGKTVSFEVLEGMLAQPEKFAFDKEDYAKFCRDLERAKSLLYITDNAGEIGFDWVLAEQLQEKYPNLKITFCVRGFPIHNDATREDYQYMGIPFPVIDNGSDAAGTDLSSISREAKTAMANADVILAKGMGNTETLWGSAYNIYFAFLVKCKRFQQVFGKPHMTPMFCKNQ